MIHLDIVAPEGASGPLPGFHHLWGWYVTGFRGDRHCQDCLTGHRAEELTRASAVPGRVTLSRAATVPYVYVCGVASGPEDQRRVRNLHLPLRHWPGASVTIETHTGWTMTARHAILLPVAALPDDHRGLPPEHARCRVFQFGVQYFGDAPPRRPTLI